MFNPGDRIELHPATDDWMRGDRFGEVVVETRRCWPGGLVTRRVRVKLDSGRTKTFHIDNVELVEAAS